MEEQARTIVDHDPTISEKEETTAPTNATQRKVLEFKSSLPKLTEPQHLQSLAMKSRAKLMGFHSLPQTLKPDISIAGSKEKAPQGEEDRL